MSERENGQLTLAKRTLRNRIDPDVLGAIKALNTKGNISRYPRQKSASGANVYLRRFLGNLGFVIP